MGNYRFNYKLHITNYKLITHYKLITNYPLPIASTSAWVRPVACAIFCTESPNCFKIRAVSSFAWREPRTSPRASPSARPRSGPFRSDSLIIDNRSLSYSHAASYRFRSSLKHIHTLRCDILGQCRFIARCRI